MSGASARRNALEADSGYAMAALLVGMSVMAVFMTAAMPVWSTAAKRMKEDELVFRGEQYAHAIALYQRKYANALPPSIDVLLNERFLRKKYLDPITGKDFQVLTGAVGPTAPGAGAGGAGASGRGTPVGQAGRGGATGGFGPGGQSTFGSSGTGFQTQPPAAGQGTGGVRIGTTPLPGGGARVGPVGGLGNPGGIVGVASTSKDKSLRVYNGRDVYSEWTFVAQQRQLQAGGEGQATPGLPGGRGQSTPGQSNQGTRGTGSRGFGGSDSFRPNSGSGSGGGFRPGRSSGGFDR